MTRQVKGTLSLEFSKGLITQCALACPWRKREEKWGVMRRTNSLPTFVRAALDGQQLSLTTFHQHRDTCHPDEGASLRSQFSRLREQGCFPA